MTCLGVACELEEDYTLSALDSFIGGTPIWIDEMPNADALKCSVCGDELKLFTQIFSPYDKAHRVLYVMACIKGQCKNSWKVFRDQVSWDKKSKSSTKKKSTNKKEISSEKEDIREKEEELQGASSWGLDVQDGTNNAEKETFSWGIEVVDDGKVQEEAEEQDCNAELLDMLAVRETEAKEEKKKKMKNKSKKKNEDATTAAAAANLLLLDSTLAQQKEKEIETNQEQQGQEAEDEHIQPAPQYNQDPKYLHCMYLDFIDEPADDGKYIKKEVEELLSRYRDDDGGDEDDDFGGAAAVEQKSKGGKRKGGGGGGGSSKDGVWNESYESLGEKKYFRKFTQRLSRCASQCIRYDWNGSILWPCEPRSIQVPKCACCGADRVFEMQLLPSLMFFLDTDSHCSKDAALIDIESIFVFSCSQSCYASLAEEYVYIVSSS